MGGDEGGLALPHDIDHLAQDAVDLGRERDLLAVRPEKEAWLGVALEETSEVEELVEVLGREDDFLVAAGLHGGGRRPAGRSADWGHDPMIAQVEKNESAHWADCGRASVGPASCRLSPQVHSQGRRCGRAVPYADPVTSTFAAREGRSRPSEGCHLRR